MLYYFDIIIIDYLYVPIIQSTVIRLQKRDETSQMGDKPN